MLKFLRKVNTHKVCIFLLTIIILFGGVIKPDNIRIFGMVPTLYRIGIPVFTLILFIMRIYKHKNHESDKFSKHFILFASVMVFWIAWGFVAMFISPYSEFNEAVKELMSLSLGLCSVYCIYELLGNRKDIDFFMTCLKFECFFFILTALFEMMTNIHFPTSRLYKEIDYQANGFSDFVCFGVPQLFLSTSIFYNINDFSTLIGVLLPLFFLSPNNGTFKKIVNILVLFSGILLLSLNDANIVLVALLLGIILYTFLVKKIWKQNTIFTLIACFVQFYASKYIAKFLIFIKSKLMHVSLANQYKIYELLDYDISGASVGNNLADVLVEQMNNASKGFGSLYMRLMMYIDSLQLTVETYFLGVGPAGFMPYFEQTEHRSNLVNPHNWWLEILTQYGIFVFLAYVSVIVYEYITMIKKFIKNQSIMFAKVISMCTVFVIACISPSSFLSYTYQWILPALCIVMIRADDNGGFNFDKK